MSRRDLFQRFQDVALAVALGAVSIAEVWVPLESVQGEGSSVLATVVALWSCALLAVRRVWPLATLLAMVAVWPTVFTVAPLPVLFWGQFVPLTIAVYSVARHGTTRRALWGAAAAAALLLFFTFRVVELATPEDFIFNWVAVTATWLAGWGLRRFEQRARAAARRAVEVEVASRAQTLAAIAEERARIARELHDIVAHAVSVMVVQAGAAEQVVDDDPAFARTALGTIRRTGSGALGEMRRVVAMLRESDERGPDGAGADRAGALEPQPGTAGLSALVEQARASGLRTELRIEGEERSLPVGVDLAVYRIVQEALTNVRRHARASSADVVVKLSDDLVEVEVSDDGAGATAEHTAGHGLIGMRERAQLYGGRLDTSSEPGSGFTVRAVLSTASRSA